MGRRADMRRYHRLRHERLMRPLVRAAIEAARLSPNAIRFTPTISWEMAKPVPFADLKEIVEKFREHGYPVDDPRAFPHGVPRFQ
jgi:hypothetical protein